MWGLKHPSHLNLIQISYFGFPVTKSMLYQCGDTGNAFLLVMNQLSTLGKNGNYQSKKILNYLIILISVWHTFNLANTIPLTSMYTAKIFVKC